MNSSSSPGDSSAYLESLMRAGQQSVKQFDDALVSAMGIEGKPPTRGEQWPFAFAANLQRQFWYPVMDFWKGYLGDESAAGSRRSTLERRFQDEAWQHSPYYELIKKSYLMTSKQLAEFVDLARAFPDTRIILDHLGGPIGIGRFADRREGFDAWRRGMAAAAKCPNVVLKIGTRRIKFQPSSSSIEFDTLERAIASCSAMSSAVSGSSDR